MTHCQSSEVPAEDQQQKEHVEDLERFSNCLEFWIQNLLIVLTVLGDCHPKNLGKPPDILPRSRSKSQTILVLLKSIYGWILNSSWWLYTATGQNKGGPPKAQPLSSKSDRFWKTRCWNVEALTSTMFTFHLYIYFLVQPQKKQLLCRCAMFFLMLMVACWKAAQIPHQHQLIWDPNHRQQTWEQWNTRGTAHYFPQI